MIESITQKTSLKQIRLIVHGVGLMGAVCIPVLACQFFNCADPARMQELAASIKRDTDLFEERDEVVENFEQAECELFALSQRLEDLKTQIPNTPEESRFLAQLTQLAEESKLGIQNFRPGRAEDSNHLKRIRVQLKGIGTYECLCQFLNGLSSLPRLTQVSTLHVDPADIAGRYPVTMELSIFFAETQGNTTKVALND